MRKIDKIMCFVIAIIVGTLAYFLRLDYSKIAAEGLT